MIPAGNVPARAISSGCIRLTNEDVIDLYDRVKMGALVVVLVADGKMSEVARVKISDAGWRALTADVINVRAKST